MRAAQFSKKNGPLELVEREMPKPGPGMVRIKVEACGICHSDTLVKEGAFPQMTYPRVPGHEVAGIIDAVGSHVEGWKVGQRVGLGWYGGHCGHCDSCRRGDFLTCTYLQIPGITYDGGYAEYMVAPAQALALIPDELSAVEAAPLMCAGITTFNGLRNSGARPSDLVGILGLGGLGHLATQFAVKMGYNPVVIARGKEKEPLAKKLGARHYIDSTTQDPAAELQKLGGAKTIIATVTNAKAMTALIGGLAINGKLLVIGISTDPIEVSPLELLSKRLTVQGWPCGVAADSQDTLAFCAMTGVRSMNQIYPLEKAKEGFDLMTSGKAKFRVILKMH